MYWLIKVAENWVKANEIDFVSCTTAVHESWLAFMKLILQYF